MTWTFTDDVRAYAPRAEALLGDDPERHTISLTVVANARAGHEIPDSLYGWWTDEDGRVTGCTSLTPPYVPLVERAPEASFAELVGALVRLRGAFTGVNAPVEVGLPLVAVATHQTGGTASLHHATRLFRCESLTRPQAPPGAARLADESDLPVVSDWYRAFNEDAGSPTADDVEGQVRVRMRLGHVALWCLDDGTPVSMCSATAAAYGVCRLGPVYTPPERRGRGFAGAVTHESTRRVLAAGQRAVLFTDLANPTSNALYPRIGYRPVADRVWFDLLPGDS